MVIRILWFDPRGPSRSKYRSKGHHPKIYPNHKNDVRLEFLAFSPFQRYLTFPDWIISSKDMVFW